MSLISHRPTTSSLRHRLKLDLSGLTHKEPEKGLLISLLKKGGRNAQGRVTVRHRGGGDRKMYRLVDFQQNKNNIEAKITALEYDPYRRATIALAAYQDGDKRYILAADGLKIGDKIMTGENVDLKVGNRLPLKNIPAGMPIHNLELLPGRGGKIVRSAGSQTLIQSKEGNHAIIKLPSGETRQVPLACYASLGQVSNTEWKNVILGKAGRKRRMGFRPTVRGVAMHPNAHPHGGGEGRSGIGMPGPKSPWGKPVGGIKTRKKNKYSDRLIITRRK